MNKYRFQFAVAFMAALSFGLSGCGETETEKQARLYREYIQAGGNPVPQQAAQQSPVIIQQPAQQAPVIVQQDSQLAEGLLIGAAGGALATMAMTPRHSSESDYAYRERQRRWDAEHSARQARQREYDAKMENSRLRSQMESQRIANERARQSQYQQPTRQAQPSTPVQNNSGMFANRPKEGTNFSRTNPAPTQSAPKNSGMFSSGSSNSSRSSSSSSRSSSSRSK